MLDPDGRVASWNGGARAHQGLPAPTRSSASTSRVSIRRGRATTGKPPEQELAMAREHGRFEDEGWRVRKDGTRFWANVVITAAATTSEGMLRGFAKVTRDLTERKRAEALEQAERHTQRVPRHARARAAQSARADPQRAAPARAQAARRRRPTKWARDSASTARPRSSRAWSTTCSTCAASRARRSRSTGKPARRCAPSCARAVETVDAVDRRSGA